MSGKYEDWAPYVPTTQDECKLPQLFLMSVHYTRGFDKRPCRDASMNDERERVEFIPKPHDDVLVVCLRRGDTGHEETVTLNGLNAGKFLNLIQPVIKKYRGPDDDERKKIREAMDSARITTDLNKYADQLRKGLTEAFPGCILVTKEPTVVEVTVPSIMMRFYLHF